MRMKIIFWLGRLLLFSAAGLNSLCVFAGPGDCVTPSFMIDGIGLTMSSVQKIARAADPQMDTSKSCYSDDRLNFGVLTYNQYFKIYRSTGLGKEGLKALKKHLQSGNSEGASLELPKTIVYLNHYGYSNGPVDLAKAVYYKAKGKYYGGKFAKDQQEISDSDSEEEREKSNDPYFRYDFFGPHNGNYYLEGKGDSLNSKKGGRSAFFTVLEKLLTGKSPVQFHCKGGIHRTGMVALMVRYLQGGAWTADNKSIATNVKRDRKPIDDVPLNNLAEREYFAHNPNNFRIENLQTVRELSKDKQFECLKKEFGPLLNAPAEKPVSRTCYAGLDLSLQQEAPALENRTEDELEVEKRRRWEKCFPPSSSQ